MGQLVGHDQGDPLLVGGGANPGLEQQRRLPSHTYNIILAQLLPKVPKSTKLTLHILSMSHQYVGQKEKRNALNIDVLNIYKYIVIIIINH